jgi:transglutaminase-like putative cysteine protease
VQTYQIQHLTRYSYEDPVSVCHHLAHLLPRESPHHLWRSGEIAITPTPAVRAERLDYFGNPVTFFAIQEPHRELSVLSHTRVQREPAPSPTLLFSSPPWERVRDLTAQSEQAAMISPAALQASQFTLPSPYVQWNRDIAAYAAESFTPQRPIFEAVMDLMSRIHRDFVYDTQSTTVSTTLPEIMAARAGVCQDFAHLIIGGLRSQGLAARYVSGYLLTTPPPGSPRLVGADASHAWASVYLPDQEGGAWLDLDPTNDTVSSDKHFTLAWGRDFGDVSPIRGVILGGGRHAVRVSVDVTPLN